MSRRILVVILIVVAIAAVGTAAGFGAYHAGYDNGAADSGHGTPVVIDGGHWHGYPGFGFFPGSFLFPLIVVIVILLIVSRRRAWHWGQWGPRGSAPDGCAPYGPRAIFDEWHRQAHAGQGQPQGPAAPSSPPSEGGSSGEGTA
jgi:hypothetical protein